MEKPFEIYNDFNELEFLFDSKWEDVFGELTKKRFGKNLLLAKIETVTISEVSSIGTTQYLSYKSEQEVKNTIHPEYLSVVKEIKETSFGSPSKYYDWYRRKDYYYAIGENSNKTITNTSFLRNVILEPTDKLGSDSYITEYEKILSDAELRQFFSDYTECLLSKNWFNELPHFFVLVMPISIPEDLSKKIYIPLGNLYLIIGTKEKVNLEDYKNYVNHLKAAWFNKFGAKILKEYSEKKTSDEYKPKYSLHKNLDKKIKAELFKDGGKEVSFSDFYYSAFDTDGYRKYLDSHLIYSYSPIIKQLIKNVNNRELLVEDLKGQFDYKNDKKNILTKNKNGLKKHNEISDESICYFLMLLSKRRIAIFLMYICNLSEEQTHLAITFGEKSNESNPESAEIYLRDNLLIYPNKIFNFSLLADREILFLKNILVEIKKIYTSFSCEFENQLLPKT